MPFEWHIQQLEACLEPKFFNLNHMQMQKLRNFIYSIILSQLSNDYDMMGNKKKKNISAQEDGTNIKTRKN